MHFMLLGVYRNVLSLHHIAFQHPVALVLAKEQLPEDGLMGRNM
jgi:hypothetical protein